MNNVARMSRNELIRLVTGQQELIDKLKEKIKEAYTDGFNDDKYDFDIENYID